MEAVDINNNPIRELQEKAMLDRTRLVWEQIHSYKYFDGEMKYGPNEGLDVLSPTWFSLNVDGIVLNIADKAYVDAAHEKGLMFGHYLVTVSIQTGHTRCFRMNH